MFKNVTPTQWVLYIFIVVYIIGNVFLFRRKMRRDRESERRILEIADLVSKTYPCVVAGCPNNVWIVCPYRHCMAHCDKACVEKHRAVEKT